MDLHGFTSDLDRRINELILFNNIFGNMPSIFINEETYDSEWNENSEWNSDFWDPVVVPLPEGILPNSVNIINKECTICSHDSNEFIILQCCNNEICQDCSIKWFNLSVYCPYCKKDLREI